MNVTPLKKLLDDDDDDDDSHYKKGQLFGTFGLVGPHQHGVTNTVST